MKASPMAMPIARLLAIDDGSTERLLIATDGIRIA